MHEELLAEVNKERFVLAPDLLLTADGPKEAHALIIEGSRISQVCPMSALSEKDAAVAQHLSMQAVIPGFIDAHTHLGQTFGKALIGGEPAQIWRRIWAPLERSLDLEGCYVSAKWQFLELLRGGYTGVINYSLNDAERLGRNGLSCREMEAEPSGCGFCGNCFAQARQKYFGAAQGG